MFAGWMFKRYQAALSDATVNFDLGELTYSQAVPKQVIALLDPFSCGSGCSDGEDVGGRNRWPGRDAGDAERVRAEAGAR